MVDQMLSTALLLISIVVLSLAHEEMNETKVQNIPYQLLPTAYIYLVAILGILSIIGFLCFVVMYTLYNGSPNNPEEYTKVWRVDKSEQLNRFKIQKLAEQALRERERRKVNEFTRDE